MATDLTYDPSCHVCQEGTHDCCGCGDQMTHYPGSPPPVICSQCQDDLDN